MFLKFPTFIFYKRSAVSLPQPPVFGPMASLIKRLTSRRPRIQGGRYPKKKDRGSIFFEVTFGLGLPKYVSGRLSIYGSGISIYGQHDKFSIHLMASARLQARHVQPPPSPRLVATTCLCLILLLLLLLCPLWFLSDSLSPLSLKNSHLALPQTCC